jgi:acetate kinase
MLLVVNAGSSSVKVVLFDGGTELARGMVAEIGGASVIEVGGAKQAHPVADHGAALLALIEGMGLSVASLTAAAHRVVHGGATLTATCRVTAEVEAKIAACIPLAPLHNPANLMGIREMAGLAPGLAQYVSFDTAFHATNPDVATAYALPLAERERGIRRYGFHGISYTALVRKVQEMAGNHLPDRLLALHLGNGASLCAIHAGRSVATTMGYSPLDGLTMGTRTGAIDGNAVLRLAEVHGIDGATRILNRESGLLGLGGASDMRALRAAGTAEAAFALDHFAYWAVRHAGSMVAAMGGLDAIAFTGGIGENDRAMRSAIVQGLGYLGAELDPAANEVNAAQVQSATSRVAIHVVPAEEERHIATEAMTLMASEASG